ncbi:putative peptide chain release factor 1, mitochondrial [Schizosaccharomyces pombe]
MLLTKKVLWCFRHGIGYQIRNIACKKGYSEHNVSRVLIEKARSLSSEYLQFHQVNNKDQSAMTNDTDLAKRIARLRRVHNAYSKFKSLSEQISDLKQMEAQESDAEVKMMAVTEINEISNKIPKSIEDLENTLLPQADSYALPALIEIRPGVGGTEAAIFANELVEMYFQYANFKGWNCKFISKSAVQGLEAITEAIFSIEGEGAYGHLMLEGGVHRVQRTPATETKGRVHTSTASVIVLPQVSNDESSSLYDSSEVKIEVMRSRGAGGQHVNRTESAVRLTHIPTGITVSMQDSRSQHQNKEKAFLVLNSRLAALNAAKENEAERLKRKNQVTSSDRSEKLRTYNFNQNRVTDHRIGLSMHDLSTFMQGEEKFDEFLEKIRIWNREQLLLHSEIV